MADDVVPTGNAPTPTLAVVPTTEVAVAAPDLPKPIKLSSDTPVTPEEPNLVAFEDSMRARYAQLTALIAAADAKIQPVREQLTALVADFEGKRTPLASQVEAHTKETFGLHMERSALNRALKGNTAGAEPTVTPTPVAAEPVSTPTAAS